jgi:hypothetical protein
VTHPECRTTVFFRSVHSGWIFKAVMKPIGVSRVYRTALICVIANRKDVIEALVAEFIDTLGSLTRDVDARLLHDRDCLRPNPAGFGTSALDLKTIRPHMTQQTLCHLAAGRIAGTKYQYTFACALRCLLGLVDSNRIVGPIRRRLPQANQNGARSNMCKIDFCAEYRVSVLNASFGCHCH